MDLIKNIEKRKTHCVIISPHQDDALLSCAGLLSLLNGKVAITIVNVFTKAHKKPYTLSAKKFLQAAGYSDAEALYKAREVEDKKALSNFKVTVVNLGLTDALFRRKNSLGFAANLLPEFDHVYPTYRWHLIKGVAHNDPVLPVLKKRLKDFNTKNTIVFAPYGTGNHADHMIVRNVCEEIFDNLVLYSDFPYNSRINKKDYSAPGKQVMHLQPDFKRKNSLLKMYKTQFLGLFPNGEIPKHKEIFYLSK